MDDRPPLDPHPLSDYVAWAGRRNRDPILSVLQNAFPKKDAHVLEFASGGGMHINYFAPHFPHLKFYPSDREPEVFPVIAESTCQARVANVATPQRLDLTDEATWDHPECNSFDAVFCINVFQVAPVTIADGMMQCASQLLSDDGLLMIYGPFKVDGGYSTDSNEVFDQTLRAAGVPEWGLKDVVDLDEAATAHDLHPRDRVDMPANNFALFYGRVSG